MFQTFWPCVSPSGLLITFRIKYSDFQNCLEKGWTPFHRKISFNFCFHILIFYLLTDFQTFCCTFYDKFDIKHYMYLKDILSPSKETINYSWKFTLKLPNQDIRPWSDCSFRNNLIWVYSVGPGLSVQVIRIIMLIWTTFSIVSVIQKYSLCHSVWIFWTQKCMAKPHGSDKV